MKFQSILVIGCLLLGLNGCGVQTASHRPPDELQYQTYLEARKPALLRKIAIIEVGHSEAGNIMRSQVALKNTGRGESQIRYKFRWFDKGGLELDPEGAPWIPVSIMSDDVIRVQGIAPSPAAKSFRVVIDD